MLLLSKMAEQSACRNQQRPHRLIVCCKLAHDMNDAAVHLTDSIEGMEAPMT